MIILEGNHKNQEFETGQKPRMFTVRIKQKFQSKLISRKPNNLKKTYHKTEPI